MTSEQRLDRLERIAKLFVRAGQCARRQLGDQAKEVDRLINLQEHLVSLQIENEHRFERSEVRLSNLADTTEPSFQELANAQSLAEQKIASLAESQTATDRRLGELIALVREGRNLDSSPNP